MRLVREIMAADGVSVHTGDMLCLHTGFSQLLLDMKKDPDPQILHNSCAVLDGNDSELQDWITQSGVAVIAADNYAVEDFPADLPNPCCSILPLHHHRSEERRVGRDGRSRCGRYVEDKDGWLVTVWR